MNSLVSIIIPTYNRAHLIKETIESVCAQTYGNWECIIVDDGSTDETLNVIKEYEIKNKKIKIYSRPTTKKKGANSCRNYGVEKSLGDYFLFLDSDDILKEDCLQTRLGVFEKFPSLDFAVFSMGLLKNNRFENYKYPDLTDASREKLIGLFITGPLPWNMTRPLWKKNFFLTQTGFNEELDMFDDDEFNLRVVYNSNIKFKFIESTDCFYRVYEENSLKYKDEVFIEKLFKSHLELLKTLNQLFNSNDKIKFKKELQQNIVGIMNGFLLDTRLSRREYKLNILIFYRNFRSSLPFKIFLGLKYFALQYPLEKKGSYRINKFLDSKINYFVEKC